ncbi:MAG: riboflavin synthase [Planctomyces sp.]|nr:riboflavin synthase [Planctomyces sp.]
MFTGLVEGQGKIRRIAALPAGLRLSVQIPWVSELQIGDSVAINGCCLTVVSLDVNAGTADFEAGEETLSKTNLGRLSEDSPVNLERSLSVGARLGGHFVQGHVDGTGIVTEILRNTDWIDMWFEVSPELSRLMVPKGSVTVDGVSLTLVNTPPGRFSVALIPHTLEVTTLGSRQVGDLVNIENDILGKYVLHLLRNLMESGSSSVNSLSVPSGLESWLNR